MKCNICSSESKPFSKARILRKYEIRYFRCSNCGFVQTEEPYWLQEAYSQPVIDSDLGLIGRNISLAEKTAFLVSSLFNPNASFIDYGGGSGMLVRMMRDKGYDFYWSDKYSTNIFAKGFKADETVQYELLTAYEIFEHLPDPIDEVRKMLSYSKNILFTTILVPGTNPGPDEWWYYSLDAGQHISLYTIDSLQKMASKLGMLLYSNGKTVHLLTTRRISPLLFKLLSKKIVSSLLYRLYRRKSLLEGDFLKITGTSISQ